MRRGRKTRLSSGVLDPCWELLNLFVPQHQGLRPLRGFRRKGTFPLGVGGYSSGSLGSLELEAGPHTSVTAHPTEHRADGLLSTS